MKRPIWKVINVITIVMFLVANTGWQRVWAADTFVVQPIRLITVKGDAAKFRALNWMNDGYSGGIKEMTIDRNLAKDEHVSFEGHALSGDNDLGAALTLTKDNFGYMKMDYGTFRKWYSSVGGYYPFNTLAVNRVNPDLSVDIGHFFLEAGMGEESDPGLSLSYEHDTKNGFKDRLTWASVIDNSSYGANVTKKTGPSFAKVKEATDTITARGKVDMANNVTLKGSQSYEFFSAQNIRDEKQLNTVTSGTPDANAKFRQQVQEPQTKLLTTNIMASRWSLNDQTYVSAGYLFAHTRNTEFETIREYTGAGVWTGAFSNSKNRDGYAQNLENKNTWTAQLMSNLTDSLVFDSKVKAELIKKDSVSSYDLYGAGLSIVGNDYAISENKTVKTGESLGLRYNGIAKTSLYSEVEMKQQRSWLSEQRIPTGSADSLIDYENIENKPEFIETIGVRVVPSKFVNMTSEFKHRFSDAKYNTIRNAATASAPANVPGESFLDELQTVTNEWATKLTWKPLKWLENSVKYKTAGTDYHTKVYVQDWIKTHGNERSLTYDLTLMPTDALMLNAAYSINLLKASTPAAGSSALYLPPFTGNVYSWEVSTSYAPIENFSVYNTLDYSRAKNVVNNYAPTTGAFLYGTDDEWYDAIVGIRWSPKKDVTVEPHYGYYGFRSNESVEVGSYTAHVFMLEVKVDW